MKNTDPAYGLGSLDFFARQTVEGFITGLHKSPFHGFSVEFAEHRQYNAGDSIRNIDWKLFARTDHLFTKRFEEETNLRAHLILDTSSSMYYPSKGPSKIQFAIQACAVLCYLLKKQRDAFGLTCISNQIDLQTPTRSSTSHYHEMIHILEKIRNQENTNRSTQLSQNLNLLAEKLSRRSLVIILSDLFDQETQNDALFDSLNHLKFKKHEVILFHTVAGKQELDFDFDAGPHQFIDPETGTEFKVNTEEVRSAYKEAIKKAVQEIKTKSLQYRFDYIEADIYKGFEPIMLPFLLKRQKVI